MSVPKHTSDIFEILSKGQFICSNSTRDSTRKLYNIIDEHFDDLYDYFKAINLVLEKGDEYYMFTRMENKTDLERKLEAAPPDRRAAHLREVISPPPPTHLTPGRGRWRCDRASRTRRRRWRGAWRSAPPRQSH